jgi:hypothetical protein
MNHYQGEKIEANSALGLIAPCIGFDVEPTLNRGLEMEVRASAGAIEASIFPLSANGIVCRLLGPSER